MRRRRLVLLLAILVGATLITVIAWALVDLPPPGLIVEYGLPPAGGPTGRTVEVEGITFVELSPGYGRVGSHWQCGDTGVWETLCLRLGLPWGRGDGHEGPDCPPHWFEVPRPIWIARTEITCGQYARFAENEDDYDYLDRPIVNVALAQAQDFCRWLSEKTEGTVRLPTGEEWEWACRAGSDAPFCYGDDSSRITEYAWCRENVRDGMEQTVGTRKPNRWGLFDMHGNAGEWCSDSTVRGGNRWTAGDECRSDLALPNAGGYASAAVGFRPVLEFP